MYRILKHRLLYFCSSRNLTPSSRLTPLVRSKSILNRLKQLKKRKNKEQELIAFQITHLPLIEQYLNLFLFCSFVAGSSK